ncbi:uncharacterized protein UV8b_07219 [Ustilaginoidea virens]|uniref:HPt domain-containing protein n=1 Tax=Ustilaginoidea virens TaxID=1159556 RepID=A0A1B5L4J7_USTVR|nr:uncharacterized protein UV8b_07219 [Ustilaginoidea virens]QUC22978.1 hypothetical protein UV8b_07219 [Ustilaginoidea virens]GAO18444.1 hypothetical protein UVI_02042420 [Ustilaginoidea virens]
MAQTKEKDENPFGDTVDVAAFGQILEMDEPENDEFSSSIVFGFFSQAEDTFTEMDAALIAEDMTKLSELGHFLKGSSATLGLVKVRDGCEKIQRYGKNENLDGSEEPDVDKCLKLIAKVLAEVKADYKDVEKRLRAYYDKGNDDDA